MRSPATDKARDSPKAGNTQREGDLGREKHRLPCVLLPNGGTEEGGEGGGSSRGSRRMAKRDGTGRREEGENGGEREKRKKGKRGG